MQKHLASSAVLAMLFIQAILVASTKAGKCVRTTVDIVFVLDESGSIYGTHFTEQLQFVQNLIDGFDIESNGTRVGVEMFSDDVRTIIQLGELMNAVQLKRIIGGIKQREGGTATHLALKRLREMFTESYSSPGASRVAIVITDGESDEPTLTALEAETVHAKNITVFAIGVGSGVKKAELDKIASQPDYVFTVDKFSELNSLLSNLTTKACPVEELETTLQPTAAAPSKSTSGPESKPATRTHFTFMPIQTKTTPKAGSRTAGKCRRTPVDAVFVLDESSSIYELYFKEQLQFIQNLIDGFDIGPNGARVGVETFGTDVRTVIHLVEFMDAERLKRIINAIQQRRGNTATHLALKRLREMFAESYNRPGASRVAIVITDGESDEPTLTALEAEKVHAQGITVFAIGVGSGAKKAELDTIASQPDYVFTVDKYSELNSLLSILTTKACPACEASMAFNIYFGLPDQLSALDTYLSLQFIQDLTAILSLTPSHVRPTLCPRTCLADSPPTESFEQSNSLDFMAALDDRRAKSITQHDLQLEYIRKQEAEYRQRNPVKGLDLRTPIAVLMLDNRLANMERMRQQVSLAQSDGIQVIAVGVGDYVDQNELWRIVKTARDAIYVRSYCQLPTIRDVVLQAVCTRGRAYVAGESVF